MPCEELDIVWNNIKAEARALADCEPMLASFYHATLLKHEDLGSALSYMLANKLASSIMPAIAIREVVEEAYAAEQKAEAARAQREKATQEADVIVKTEIDKRRRELEAEAEAEQIRRRAKGEADAILAKMQAEAQGAQEILVKQADGLRQIVAAAGGDADHAVRLMLADKMEELMRIQVDAVKGIKIDKVTVWDGGEQKDGKTATAGFVSGLMKSIPPMNEMFDMAGMELPRFLGKNKEEPAAPPAPAAEPGAPAEES